MKLYSIGELEVLSRIKSHTIRVWEQRYGLLEPVRSEGNTRYYTEEQLMKLLKVALLNKNGIKISHIAQLNDQELIDKASEIALSEQSIDIAVEQLMVASLKFDQIQISTLFKSYFKRHGFEDTFEKIIFPYLKVVGNLWVNGKITPGHEHFFTNLCRLKLFAEVEKLTLSNSKSTVVLFAQPEWDFHELGILYHMYLFRKAGYLCTYLGQAVPSIDAIQTANTIKANYIISTFIGPTNKNQILKYIDEIIKGIDPKTEFLISGPHVNFPINKYGKQLSIFNSVDVLIKRFNLK